MPTSDSALPRVAGVETSDRIALNDQDQVQVHDQVQVCREHARTYMESCTLPSLIPPIARDNINDANEVD